MTEDVALDEGLINRFDYDEVFGVVLNRFLRAGRPGYASHPVWKGGADTRLPGHP